MSNPVWKITTPEIRALRMQVKVMLEEEKRVKRQQTVVGKKSIKASRRIEAIVYARKFPKNYTEAQLLEDFRLLREDARAEVGKRLAKLDKEIERLEAKIELLRTKEYKKRAAKSLPKVKKEKRPIEEDDVPTSTASLISNEAEKLGGGS